MMEELWAKCQRDLNFLCKEYRNTSLEEVMTKLTPEVS